MSGGGYNAVAEAQRAVDEWIKANRSRVGGMSRLDQVAAYVQEATGGKGLLKYRPPTPPQVGRAPLLAEDRFDVEWRRAVAYWRTEGLSTRASHVLANAGCTSMTDLKSHDAAWLSRQRGGGAKTVKEVSALAGWRDEPDQDVEMIALIDRALPRVMSEITLSEGRARRLIGIVLSVVTTAGGSL